MKWLKRLAITVISLAVLLVAGFYLYIETLPTAPPQYVDVSNLNNAQASEFACSAGESFNYAYQVNVEVEAKIAEQFVYQSTIQFNTQLQQANDNIIKAIATDIKIDEGQGAKAHQDVYYLSRVMASNSAVFTAYNDLGLVEKHPMKILSQLLKALSVGQEGEAYFYSYDPSRRTYKYRHNNGQVERASFVTTANTDQLTHTLFDDNKNSWQAKLDNSCVPAEISSVDRQGFMAGDKGGYIRFSIKANKIANYIDLADHQINGQQNIAMSWQTQQVSADKLAVKVESEQEMLDIITSFKSTRDVAALIKAAQYMMDNIPADQLATKLLQDQLTDSNKNDIAFALSMLNQEGVEDYIAQTINALPANAGNNIDMQKVRLMVALSGNAQSGQQSFNNLNQLRNNPNESANVQKNSLINMGTVADKMQQAGDSSGVDEFEKIIKQELNSAGDSSSEILAAGNAKLDGLDNEIGAKLGSNIEKERYAAATVMSRNPDNNAQMVEHIANENSVLVVNAILGNLKASELSSSEIAQLEQVANTTNNADIKKLIENKLQ